MADSATAGLGAQALDKLGVAQGPDGQTVAQQVEGAGKDIGPVASTAADLAGYAVGPGKLAVGEKLASLAGGKLLARMGGSAAEGALASGVGTLGHGGSLQDAGTAATVGGLTGALTGALPGGRGARPVTPPNADLQATASGLYTPLKSKVYPPVGPASAMTKASLDVDKGLESKMSSNMGDKIAQINRIIGSGGNVTADNIASFQSALRGAARNPADEAIAEKYAAQFNKGVGSKTAADIAAANRASNIAQTGSEIEGWAANPAGAPAAVKSALENYPNFYKTQPGLFDALNAVGKKAPSADPSISSEVGKAVGKHLLGMAIGGATGYALGNPYEGIATTALGAASPMAFSRLARIPTRNALLAAQHLNATGMKVDPGVYTNRFLQGLGVMSRQAGYGAGSAGRSNRQANR